MGSRGTRKFPSGSTSYHHRLSDGLYTFPSPVSVRTCEMTDQSFQTNYNNNHSITASPEIDYSNNRKRYSYIAGIPSTSTENSQNIDGADASINSGANNNNNNTRGSGLFLSYFGGNEIQKKKETPFINFGFRRKSSVFYAATD